MDQMLSKVTLEADKRSNDQVILGESQFGGMSLQQCGSGDLPIELCTAQH